MFLEELTNPSNWEIDEQWMDGAPCGYSEATYVGDPVFIEAAKELAALRLRLANTETLLTEAIQHLEWCGYGDGYERESVRNHKLPQRLEAWLERAGDTHK
jgi:hypothetical protein